jgi:hypothetical protein
VSTFTSCVTLPHLGSVPFFVYPPKNPTVTADSQQLRMQLGGRD